MSKEALRQMSTGIKAGWAEKTRERVKNKRWLTYSSQIARRILAEIKENQDLNQKKIAAALGVTPQYISQILKGEENLSLETIAKISAALGVELISFPDYLYSVPAKELAGEFVVYTSKNAEPEYVVKPNKDIITHFTSDPNNSETGGTYVPNIQVTGCSDVQKYQPSNA